MSEIPQAAPEPQVGVVTGATAAQPLPNLPMMTHDEAEALRLRTLKQERISAILVAVLIHALIIVGLALWGLGVLEAEKPEIEARIAPPSENTVERPTVKTETLQRKPSAPSQSAKLIAAAVPESAVFVPEVPFETDSIDIGTSANLGMGFGISGSGSGDGQGGFGTMPPGMKGRCTLEERMKRLIESGGTKECEDAVVKSLTWLQVQQNPDGSWENKFQCAMTGMALLAYLGHCETPQSTQFGDTVTNAIVYLVDVGMKNDGYLVNARQGHSWVYEHAIATYALAESLTFCNEMKIDIPNLAEVTKKAGEIIMDGQAKSGGWNYNYGDSPTAGDNSVGFWQIQAMKACKHTKLWPESKFSRYARNALDFLEKVQGENGAVGYRNSPSKSPQLTGGAMLAFQMWDKANSKPAKKGIKYVEENNDFKWGESSSNLYYHYYIAQAMINEGGSTWDKYRVKFQQQILDAQKEDGSWTQRMAHGPVNDHMATCLATFMLEVYYRFLPGTG